MSQVVRHHGVVLKLEDERGTAGIWARPTRTKRGCRKAYREALDDALRSPADAVDGPPTTLIVARIESGWVVEQARVPSRSGGDAPDAGVREPRRPRPFTGGAA